MIDMKRIYLALTLGVLCLALNAQNKKELLILHTNDTHSRIESISPNDPDTVMAGRGGYVRRATMISNMRKDNQDLLLFDCGDFSQGSPFYNMFKGEVEVKLMNEMKYDAATIGNHEFDFGLDNMARLFKMANFPFVCANYDFIGTPVEGLVKPYTIINREGLKIGVLGVGPRLKGLVQDKNFKGVKFEDPIEAAQRVAKYLKEKEKCDVVICLSHLGWQGKPYSDETLIQNTRNIDVVLGGHSHSMFTEPKWYSNMDGKKIPLQQMGKNGAFVGEMKLGMKKK